MRREYMTHFHEERNHQGKGNVLLSPSSKEPSDCLTVRGQKHPDFDLTEYVRMAPYTELNKNIKSREGRFLRSMAVVF